MMMMTMMVTMMTTTTTTMMMMMMPNKWLNEEWRLKRNSESPLSIVSDVWRFMNGVCTSFQPACPLRDSWKRSPGVVVYIVIGCAHTRPWRGISRTFARTALCLGWLRLRGASSPREGKCVRWKLLCFQAKTYVPWPCCVLTDRNNYMICAICVEAKLTRL